MKKLLVSAAIALCLVGCNKKSDADAATTTAQAGKSIIVVSSEMAEVIGLCHRVVVMRAGRLTGELTGRDITEENIVRLAVGIEGDKVA